ncbi:3-oxoacyl-ACP reductase [Bermanella sp. 47_1433_sub80_T6]|nr:3-oxoacyl-ACP reductase [Bermanella sp. 47_1433_sub80_T6]
MGKMIESLFYSKAGQAMLSAAGVKSPLELSRYQGENPWVTGLTVLAQVASPELQKVLQLANIRSQVFASGQPQACEAMLIDASHFTQVAQLDGLKVFFSQASGQLKKSGHIVILGLDPESCDKVETAAVMEALSGFTRSYAKEMGRKGISVNLIYTQQVGAALATPLNFLLSHRSSYISGQPLYVNNKQNTPQDWQKPLAGKTALVTGAAQGIGAAIARTLSRDGAKVIGLDIPAAQQALDQTMAEIQGVSLATDITSEQVSQDISEVLAGEKLDILVHNAGITRDKTLSRMPDHFWQMTLNINLQAPINVTGALEQANLLSDDARVICISSISGIAGNVGQTNYAASKSGVAGFVRKQAQLWQDTGKTINAIAPGFIETQMTDQIPFMTREIGRRMNSLSQGGQPVDVAEGVALFAQPGSNGLNGQLLRVCGQSLIGA